MLTKKPFVWEVQMAIIIFKNNWQSSSSTPKSSLQVKYGAWMPSQCLHGGHLLRFSKHKEREEKDIFLKYSRRLALKLRWGMANNRKTFPALVTTCQTFREAVTSWAPGLRCWQFLWKLFQTLWWHLFSRGPCGEHEVLGLQQDTLEPECVANSSKVILLVMAIQMSCHKNLFWSSVDTSTFMRSEDPLWWSDQNLLMLAGDQDTGTKNSNSLSLM